MKAIDRKTIRVASDDKIIGSDTGSLNASSTEAPCSNGHRIFSQGRYLSRLVRRLHRGLG
jgi:hypothetical protein